MLNFRSFLLKIIVIAFKACCRFVKRLVEERLRQAGDPVRFGDEDERTALQRQLLEVT